MFLLQFIGRLLYGPDYDKHTKSTYKLKRRRR